MTATLSVASEAHEIARQLIGEHHQHLSEAQILYIFTDQRRRRCDRVRLGSAAKLSSLQRFLASGLDGVEQGPDFVILIDETAWLVLPPAARVALVDHELCHCALFVKDESQRPAFWRRFDQRTDTYDESEHDYRWGLRGHDIEEFGEVLYRHGFWKPDEHERYVKAVALQLVMPGQIDQTATNGSSEHEQGRRRRRGAKTPEQFEAES
ncbi:MAG TPA: putative metallopeptidase [Candidatus Acidoferrum sp.]|nr:putative metallopeptidase [Candidatus Acidoferrum sp.]HXJ32333.1 putative metallopeptidase [Gemmatimonadales bacterium]